MAKCVSKATGKPLSAYETEKEAKESAKYSKKEFKLDLYPYKCENCGKYHLAPKESKIKVEQNACSCRDTNGKPKALYATKKDAEKQQANSEKEQKVKLYIYKCPDKKGFHLTHHSPDEYKDIPKEKKTAAPAKKPATVKKAAPAKKTAEKKTTAKKTTITKKK